MIKYFSTEKGSLIVSGDLVHIPSRTPFLYGDSSVKYPNTPVVAVFIGIKDVISEWAEVLWKDSSYKVPKRDIYPLRVEDNTNVEKTNKNRF